ncbi:MAG: CorA family divalent cation transporter [Myxococcota bacterium]
MSDALFDDDVQLLPADWDVPPSIRGRLGHSIGRQRAMFEGGHLLLVTHRVPDPEDHERRGCLAWRDLTGRWRSTDGREGRLALRETIDEYQTTLAGLDDRLERQLAIHDHFEVLEHLAPITRAARHLHATLQQGREACRDDRALIDLRDQAYAMERRAELLTVDARFSLDRALARSSHEHTVASRQGAEATDRLNRMAATFLPIGTVAALLGMNIPSGLEGLPAPWPFVLVVVVGLLIGMALSWTIHRPTSS